MNWTGHVVAAPRSDLPDLLDRPEVSRTGIYLLLGDDPNAPSGLRSYIGEADEVRTRLVQHAKSSQAGGKDFWERAVVLTNKDANLTKAHARYLESRLIEIARSAKRTALDNQTSPPTLPLPEADISDIEQYLAQAMLVLPILGVNIFRTTTVGRPPSATPGGGPVEPPKVPSPSTLFVLTSKKHGIEAQAQEVDGEFTVAKGSLARSQWDGDPKHSYKQLFEQLVGNGTMVDSATGKHLEFAHDQVFSSPSAAAAVVLGRSANGRDVWRVEGTSTTYGAWQAQSLDKQTGQLPFTSG